MLLPWIPFARCPHKYLVVYHLWHPSLWIQLTPTSRFLFRPTLVYRSLFKIWRLYFLHYPPPPDVNQPPHHPPPPKKSRPSPQIMTLMGMALDIIWSLTWATYHQNSHLSLSRQNSLFQWLNSCKNAPGTVLFWKTMGTEILKSPGDLVTRTREREIGADPGEFAY